MTIPGIPGGPGMLENPHRTEIEVAIESIRRIESERDRLKAALEQLLELPKYDVSRPGIEIIKQALLRER